jgi:hypothetical protein
VSPRKIGKRKKGMSNLGHFAKEGKAGHVKVKVARF